MSYRSMYKMFESVYYSFPHSHLFLTKKYILQNNIMRARAFSDFKVHKYILIILNLGVGGLYHTPGVKKSVTSERGCVAPSTIHVLFTNCMRSLIMLLCVRFGND